MPEHCCGNCSFVFLINGLVLCLNDKQEHELDEVCEHWEEKPEEQ